MRISMLRDAAPN